jgi:penicillin-binding protein 2
MDDLQRRHRYFVVALAVLFVFLVSWIWYLQVIRGEEFAQLATNNRIRIRSVPASRGMILDRNEEMLVDNRPSFQVSLVPEDIEDVDQVVRGMADTLDQDPEVLRSTIVHENNRRPFWPVLIKADISRKELAFLETYKMDLPGMVIEAVPRRSYHYDSLASHLLGYLGEIDHGELKEMASRGYHMGDFVGKDGIEKQWETMLRGVDGGRQVEFDSLGREIRILRSVPSRAGHNVVLTIDLEIQKTVEDLLKGKIGAAVAMDPRSGQILAMASAPAFNPDLFASGICREDWINFLTTPFHPLQNKAIQGQYPPGSVFKIVTAIAALEEGVITPEETLHCPGFFRLGTKTYRCWKKGGHGTVDLRKALVESCDVYFYQVALRLGIDTLARYAREFGLGRRTGIELGDEKPGLIPTTAWKRQRYNEPWYKGETVVSGIGQGAILVTPIQMVNMISAIGNGGVLFRPQVIQRVEDAYGKSIEEYPSMVMQRVSVSEKTLQIIRDALRGVVEDPRGTGRPARIKGVSVCGKTGTAQAVKLEVSEEIGDEEEVPIQYRDHAWFVAYAPEETPVIAVAVLIQHGGHGASAAAPVARRIIETALKRLATTPSKVVLQDVNRDPSH